MSYRGGQLWAAMLDRSRRLRRDSTDAERLPWRSWRARQLGAKFRRQQEVGPHIVDFLCVEHGLAIEVDGSQHLEAEARERDEARTRYLMGHRLRVLRFDDREVLLELPAVLEVIQQAIDRPSP